MPLFTKDSRSIVFVHIPKTAGTSVESHFRANGWSMSFWSYARDEGRVASDQHLLYSELAARIPGMDEMYSFAIVRHPIKRLISEWRWQRWHQKRFKDTLSEFVRRVADSLATDKVYWDNHWRPQSDFLAPGLDRICKLEDLERDYPVVIAESGAGFDPLLPHENRSKTLFQKYLHWRFKNDLTDEDLKIVSEVYAEDFESLGYTCE